MIGKIIFSAFSLSIQIACQFFKKSNADIFLSMTQGVLSRISHLNFYSHLLNPVKYFFKKFARSDKNLPNVKKSTTCCGNFAFKVKKFATIPYQFVAYLGLFRFKRT